MNPAGPTVLLLTSPLAPAAGRRALHAALAAHGPVLAPAWTVDAAAADLLAEPAARALGGLAGVERPVVVCAVGGGVVLALRLAATTPDRVVGLALATGRTAPGSRLVRSVHRGVADLLPLVALQRLHAGERQLLQTLDLVRLQDVRELAARVPHPVRVGWGRADPYDRLTTRRMVDALPGGRLVPLDGAGPGWAWAEPDRVAGLVTALDREV